MGKCGTPHAQMFTHSSFYNSPPKNLIYFHVRMKKGGCVLKLQYNETNENVHLGFTVGPGCICFHQQHILSYILSGWVRATGFIRDLMNPLYIHLHLIMWAFVSPIDDSVKRLFCSLSLLIFNPLPQMKRWVAMPNQRWCVPVFPSLSCWSIPSRDWKRPWKR